MYSSSFADAKQKSLELLRIGKHMTCYVSLVPIFFLLILFIAAFIPNLQPQFVPEVIYTMNILFAVQAFFRKVLHMQYSSVIFTVSLLVEMVWLYALVDMVLQ